MSNSTTFVDFSAPAIFAGWLNDVNKLTYVVCGDGSTNPPTTAAQLIANLGLATQAGFQQNTYSVATAGGTADALTASFTPTIAALTNGMSLYIRAASANATATPTLNVNGLGAKTIYKGNGLALAAGDIAGAGHWIEVQYDTTLTGWVLLNPATGVSASGLTGFRNRIINGDMRIDQRNNGSAVTVNNATVSAYVMDRFLFVRSGGTGVISSQRASSGISGTPYCATVTVTTNAAPAATDQTSAVQYIEGQNVADLAWGTASAKPLTISFQVKSSVTGTFGLTVRNGTYARAYVASYTIAVANTWQSVSITIPGDTTGTWATDNSIGMAIIWDLGVGTTYSQASGSWTAGAAISGLTGGIKLISTASATWSLTNVQVESGATATAFEQRPIGVELALCQRYLPAWNWQSGNDGVGFGYSVTTTSSLINVALPVTPRVAPNGVTASGFANLQLRNGSNIGGPPTAITLNVGSSFANPSLVVTTTAGSPTLVGGQGAFLYSTGAAQILFNGCEL